MTDEREILLALRDEFAGALRYTCPAWGRSLAAELADIDDAAHAGDRAAVLIPLRTDTRWFHEFVCAWEVRALRGRVRLHGARGAAPFPSAVVLVGPVAQLSCWRYWDLRGYAQTTLPVGPPRLSPPIPIGRMTGRQPATPPSLTSH